METTVHQSAAYIVAFDLEKAFFTADVLTCHSRRDTCVTIDHGSVQVSPDIVRMSQHAQYQDL